MALKHLKFITAILTAGAFVAALSTAAPVHAGERDGVKIFLGTAATILLLHELDKRQNKERKERKERKAHDSRQPVQQAHDRGRGWQEPRRDRGGYRDQHHRRDFDRPAGLPRECLRDTRHQGLVMGAGCLNRNYGAAGSLPGVCRTQFRNNGKTRSGFDYSCLRSRGYTLARR